MKIRKLGAALGAASVAMLLLEGLAFAPSWPICVPCQLSRASKVLSVHLTPTSSIEGSIHYLQAWSDMQGYGPLVPVTIPSCPAATSTRGSPPAALPT